MQDVENMPYLEMKIKYVVVSLFSKIFQNWRTNSTMKAKKTPKLGVLPKIGRKKDLLYSTFCDWQFFKHDGTTQFTSAC